MTSAANSCLRKWHGQHSRDLCGSGAARQPLGSGSADTTYKRRWNHGSRWWRGEGLGYRPTIAISLLFFRIGSIGALSGSLSYIRRRLCDILQQILPKKYRMSREMQEAGRVGQGHSAHALRGQLEATRKQGQGRQPALPENEQGHRAGLPQGDEFNPGVAWWGSKRIWLGHKPKGRYRREVAPGHKTQLRKLFELLAQPPGRWHPVSEIHEVVFGKRVSKAETKRAAAERSPAHLPSEATNGPVASGRGRDRRCQIL